MPKLVANLTMLFNEVEFIDRFEAAAYAGFRGVEFLFPYALQPEHIAEKCQRYQLKLVLHNLPAGNWEKGERGIACFPDRVGEFQQGVEQALLYAQALNVKELNCLAGIRPQGFSDDKVQETLVSNLQYAAAKLKKAGIRLLIEPVNTFDIP